MTYLLSVLSVCSVVKRFFAWDTQVRAYIRGDCLASPPWLAYSAATEGERVRVFALIAKNESRTCIILMQIYLDA